MNSSEFDDVLDAHFLGNASESERARLEELLRGDVDHRRRFVEAALFEARLHGVLSSAAVAATIGESDRLSKRPPTTAARRVVQRLGAGLRRFDLVAFTVVAVVAIIGLYVVRVGFTPPVNIGPNDLPMEPEQAVVEPKPDGGLRRVEGKIESVDVEATTFVLAIDETERATFRAPAVEKAGREAAEVLLDGRRTTFDDAVRLRRNAVVTFQPQPDGEAWVWKVEVTSESR